MSYPYSVADLAALDRLATVYNGLAYDAGSNPGGMAAGGHRTNFIPAVQDLALVGAAVEDAADAAAASAVLTAADVVTTAANVSKLNGTSTTSVSIGSGSKSFTTQASKSFDVGTFVKVVSNANPTTNYMLGQVTAYSGTALTINVPPGAYGGSGSFTDWTIYGRAGTPGVTGPAGTTGAAGTTPALKWAFGNGTSDADPGNGIVLINNATYSSATFLYFDNLDYNGATQTTFLDALDDSTNAALRGTLFLQQVGSDGVYVMFNVTGAVTDGTGYRKVPVAPVMSNGSFTNGAAVAVTFVRTGNKGADGAGAGDVIGPTGAGDGKIVLFDSTTGKLVKDSTYGLGTSGANVGALNGNNTYSGTSAFSGTVAYSSTMIGTVANANALTVGPNGATNPTLKVNTATASAATGLSIVAAAAAAGLALAVISSGTDENLTIDTKGTGTITFNATGTGAIQFSRNAVPTASDGAALGTAALMWSDHFKASGHVDNWNSGNVLQTHSAGILTLNPGILKITTGTASTSTTTGDLVLTGGAGIGGAVNVVSTLWVGVASSLDANANIQFQHNKHALWLSTTDATASFRALFVSRTASDGNMVTFLRAGSIVGAIEQSGSAVAYNTTSDIRGKPNRELLTHGRARGYVDSLRIWDFDKAGNSIRGIGVIAQEAREVHKSLATPGATPEEYWTAEKAGPVPFLVANMQWANAEIDAIKKHIRLAA